MTEIMPADLTVPVGEIVRERPGEWLTPHEIWERLQEKHPRLARRVSSKVETVYKTPERNNEVWFVSNTFYHLDKLPEFKMSNTEEHPELAAPGVWLIIRAGK